MDSIPRAHQIKTPISAMRLLLQAEDNEQMLNINGVFKIEEYRLFYNI